MAMWRPQLIPKKTLQGKRITGGVDADGYPKKDTEADFDIENASVHAVNGYSLQAVPEGYRNTRVVQVFTTTEVNVVDEGTDQKGDLVEFESGKWGRAIKVEPWTTGVLDHFRVYVTEVNER